MDELETTQPTTPDNDNNDVTSSNNRPSAGSKEGVVSGFGQDGSFEDRRRELVALAQKDREAFIGGYNSASDDVTLNLAESAPESSAGRTPEASTQADDTTTEPSMPSTNASTASDPARKNATLDGTEVIFPVTQKIIKFLGQFANQHPETPVTGPVPSALNSSSNSSSSVGGTQQQQQQQPQRSGEELAQAYKRLLAKLRDPSMSDILKGVRAFVHRFNEEHAIRSVRSVGDNNNNFRRDDDSMSMDSASSPVIPSGGGTGATTTTTSALMSPGGRTAAVAGDDDADDVDSECDDDDGNGGISTWDADCMPGENNPDMLKVQTFLRHLESKVKAHALWNKPNRVSEADWDMDREALEKFVLTRIHKAAFASRAVDKRIDRSLARRIRSLSFVERKHLDIRYTGEALEQSWELAANELRRMNEFRAPRDKMVCVLNCCRVITTLLTQAAAAEHQAKGGEAAEARLPGADEFLPALIHVVLRANPPQLHSNIEYIASFRDPSRLIAEAGYFFTHLTSAVAFVQQMDATMLSISKEAFEAGLALANSCVDNGGGKHGNAAAITVGGSDNNGGTCSSSTSNNNSNINSNSNSSESRESSKPRHLSCATEGVLTQQSNESVVGLQAVLDHSGAAMCGLLGQVPGVNDMEAWRETHCRFMNTSSDALRVSEASQLLDEYKYLANMCLMLLQERQGVAGTNK